MSVDVEIDERALREIYLPPFEAAVREGGAWAVMAAYNRFRGSFCSENPELLLGVLKDEWGFDGVVVSDYFGTHSSEAVDAGLDLEMPGPPAWLGEHLLAAVTEGRVTREAVEAAASRMLRLMDRTGGPRARRPSRSERIALARGAAAEGVVLLVNRGILPMVEAGTGPVAVIGPAAARLCPQGGGAAEVTPPYVRSPIDALTDILGPGRLVHAPGCVIPGPIPFIGPGGLATDDGDEGVMVEYFDNLDLGGDPVGHEIFTQTQLIWSGPPHHAAQCGCVLGAGHDDLHPRSERTVGLRAHRHRSGPRAGGRGRPPRQPGRTGGRVVLHARIRRGHCCPGPRRGPTGAPGGGVPNRRGGPARRRGEPRGPLPPPGGGAGAGGRCRPPGRRGPRLRRDEQPLRVRGGRPVLARVARGSGRSDPSGGGGEPADGGRGQQRRAGLHGLGRRGRCRPPGLVPGTGGRRRHRGRALGPGRRHGPSAHHLPPGDRGHTGLPHVPRGRRGHGLRGVHLRRLPPLRPSGARAPLPLRPWPLVHHLRLPRPPGRGRRRRDRPPRRLQHGRPPGQHCGPALRATAAVGRHEGRSGARRDSRSSSSGPVDPRQ